MQITMQVGETVFVVPKGWDHFHQPVPAFPGETPDWDVNDPAMIRLEVVDARIGAFLTALREGTATVMVSGVTLSAGLDLLVTTPGPTERVTLEVEKLPRP